MTLETAVDTLRGINAVLATVAAIAYTLRINHVWELRTPGQRLIRVGFTILLFAAAWASAEALVQDAETGLRAVFIFAGCITVLVGLWRARQHPDKSLWS